MTTPLPDHTKQANEALRAASNRTLDTVKQVNAARNAQLPEPAYKRLSDLQSGIDDWYSLSQLEAYGAAEYKRGIEDAALTCTNIALSPSNVTLGTLGVAIECAQAIRKLGETS